MADPTTFDTPLERFCVYRTEDAHLVPQDVVKPFVLVDEALTAANEACGDAARVQIRDLDDHVVFDWIREFGLVWPPVQVVLQ